MARYEMQKTVMRQVAAVAGLPFVDLVTYRVSPGLLAKVDGKLARSRRCVPMVYNPRRIVLVTDDVASAFYYKVRPHELGFSRSQLEQRELEFALTTTLGLESSLARCC